MNQADARTAALTLRDEHARGVRFHPFAVPDIAAAYAVQEEYVRLLRTARRAGVAGYKVGLTSARMQAMCRIDSPIAGVVLDDGVQASGARLARANYGRLGLEFEIAVRMGRDLGRNDGGAEVAEAIEAVAPAIEVVDDRGCDYATLDVLSLVADNSWNAGIVLGDFRPLGPDLSAVEGVVSLDGVETDRGFGRDVLGHPFASVAWLAGRLAASGGGLKRGDVVMTGSIVTTKFPDRPCSYIFALDGLGAVAVTVE